MGQKQTAFDCVSCFFSACPHKDDPVITKVKLSSSLSSDVDLTMTVKEQDQINRLCEDCTDFVKYL